MNQLWAGTAKQIITPSSHLNLGGYPGHNSYKFSFLFKRPSQGVHDDIFARCLILSLGEQTLALVSLDLICYYKNDIETIRRLVYAKNTEYSPINLQIVVGATHAHSGPDTYGVYGGVPQSYKDFVNEQTAIAILQALNNLKPARISVNTVAAPEGTFASLRNPDTVYADQAITALFIQAADKEENIATLVNFACHADVLWSDNYLISADFPGAMCQYLDRELGGMTLFFNGAVGDIYFQAIARDFYNAGNRGRTFADMERYGTELAQYVLEAQHAMHGVPSETLPPLLIDIREVEVPVDNLLLKILQKIGVLKKKLRNGKLSVDVWVIDLGPLRIITMPAQIFSSLGRELKEAIRKEHLMIFCLTNDENGYVVPEADFIPGGKQERISLGPRTWSYLKQAALKNKS